MTLTATAITPMITTTTMTLTATTLMMTPAWPGPARGTRRPRS
jgi:hypothetical protein